MNRKGSNTYRDRLTSLTTHLRRYEKPTPFGYNNYATTYIPSDIPWRKILSDETGSYTAESLPFSTKFKIGQYVIQEKERKVRGESVRKKDLLPSSKEITQDLRDTQRSDGEAQLSYLYFKAMQHSELNKALALDEKYPKPDENVIRATYSKEHQAAVAATLLKRRSESTNQVGSEFKCAEAPFQRRAGQLIRLPQVLLSTSEKNRLVATEVEQEALTKLRRVIIEALGKPSPIKDLQNQHEPWQFRGKPDRPRAQPPKKRKLPWKRNTYPPKSAEERIAELRRMAPPLKSEHLETDQLPGLWEPELIIESFKTAAMEEEEEKERLSVMTVREDDWWRMFQARSKCLHWLKSIPDEL